MDHVINSSAVGSIFEKKNGDRPSKYQMNEPKGKHQMRTILIRPGKNTQKVQYDLKRLLILEEKGAHNVKKGCRKPGVKIESIRPKLESWNFWVIRMSGKIRGNE